LLILSLFAFAAAVKRNAGRGAQGAGRNVLHIFVVNKMLGAGHFLCVSLPYW
jgi:hypothetical protein